MRFRPTIDCLEERIALSGTMPPGGYPVGVPVVPNPGTTITIDPNTGWPDPVDYPSDPASTNSGPLNGTLQSGNISTLQVGSDLLPVTLSDG